MAFQMISITESDLFFHTMDVIWKDKEAGVSSASPPPSLWRDPYRTNVWFFFSDLSLVKMT